MVLLALGSLAASPPEVVRVRVPSSRVSSYFPPRATLRTLGGDQFEALVAQAGAGARASGESPGSAVSRRPVRVDHFARWENGTLVGRSKMTLPATGADPALIACIPWSPALLDSEDQSKFARSDQSGRLVLVQPPNQPVRVVELRWRQSAHPDSLGRAFALRLPDADVAHLSLDLEPNVVPSSMAAPGSFRESEPTQVQNLNRWDCAGASGWFPIQIRSKTQVGDEPGAIAQEPRVWVGGPTRIDLNTTGANWVADWRVERTPNASKKLWVELDDGLEFVGVIGPEVIASRLEPGADRPESGRRVEVSLRGDGATSIAIQGRVQPPAEGAWLIPSARPAIAGWLGGRTEVRLDPSRILTRCVERSGRRVAARPDEAASPSTSLFESDARPGPLAELHFDRPRADASVQVEGTLRVGSIAPRVEVVATWTLGRGRLFDPTLDFPRGWVVDRVVGPDGRSSSAWHVEPTREGNQRVHFDRPPVGGEPSIRTFALVVSATRIEPSPARMADLISLPRVRPSAGSVRVADERWVAAIEPGWEVEPATSRGLVWFDSATLGNRPAEESALELVASPSPLGQKLAWRWVAEDGEATLLRKRDRRRPEVDERLEASIVGGRLHLVWFWTVAEVARPDSLSFHLPLDDGVAPRWRWVDRSGGAIIEPRSLDLSQRMALGFPTMGVAAELGLNHFSPGSLTIRGETELAWSGSGSIPWAKLAPSVTSRRSVVVRVEDDARFRIDRAEGLSPVGWTPAIGDRPSSAISEATPYRALVGDDVDGLRVAAAWVGEGPSGRLDVSTLANPSASDGNTVITEACLTSRVSPGSNSRHRLILRVAPGSAQTLDLRMPPLAMLDRIRRDGQPSVVAQEGQSLRVSLARTDPSRPTSTITLDYRTAESAAKPQRISPLRFLPTVSVPCLSFTWQVNTPPGFQVASDSADLMLTDLFDDPRALDRSWWGQPRGRELEADTNSEAPVVATMFADLDRTLQVATPTETTLGDWLIKLDAGRWPLVLDRLLLQGVGWGPKSRINVVDFDPKHPMTASAVFHSLGLAIEPVGATFLISTEASRQVDLDQSLTVRDRSALRQILFDAAVAGADRSDRFQSPSRWRGEPTPRAWLANETPDRGLVANGWWSHRFAASNWPTESMAIKVDDPQATSWRIGLVAVGLTTLLGFVGVSRFANRRARSRAALSLTFLLGLSWSASARFDPVDPIIALLPYDELAEIESKPSRVVLRQEDHDRLVQLAHHSRLGDKEALVLWATHHVARPSTRSVLVESRYELAVLGSSAASSNFPVGSAFDLSATIDGQPSPLLVSGDGQTASLTQIPLGRHQVVLRRSVTWVNAGVGRCVGSIRIPVLRSAMARVEVDRGNDSEPIELPELAGMSELRAETLLGELGPRADLEIRWGANAGSDTGRPEATATVRWDAQPAGDRLIARLTVSGQVPLRSIRLALEPGVSVLGQTVPGLVAISTSGSPTRPEWVAHVDPPLRPGALCEITLWRSAPPGSTRTMPRLQLVSGQVTGLVGFRKLDGWTGRLSTTSGSDAPSELDFVRRWGPMTADGFDLAGAARFDGDRAIVADVAHASFRRTVRDQVGAEVVAGGLRFVVDSVFKGPAPSWEAEATFDGPLRVNRVEAAGLEFWTQDQPNQVRLVFDGSKPARERAVHLEGFATPPGASAAGGAGQTASTNVPWPRWTDSTLEPGRLIVSGGEGVQVVSGGQILAEDLTRSAPTPGRTRTYSMTGDDPAARVDWTIPPARVNVSVGSDLRLDPTRAVWTADVVCDVSGGSIRTLYWKLPTAWAAGASLAIDGFEQRFQAEARGDATFWTIPLDRPVWNRRTLTVRSARPWSPGLALDYPNVSPLSTPGGGKVGRYDLTVTSLSGWPLGRETSSGITPLPSLGDHAVPSLLPGRSVSRAFRVATQPWSLRFPADPTTIAIADATPLAIGQFDDERRLARLDHIDLKIAVSSTMAQGQAEVQVRPGPAFLGVNLPEGTRLIGASVEGRPASPIGPQTGGRWLIPLGDRNARKVGFGWVQPTLNVDQARAGAVSAALPRFDQPSVPTSIRVTSTIAKNWAITGGTWNSVLPIEASLRRFERLGAEVVEAIGRMGPEPTAAGSVAILRPLVEMALSLRAATRSTGNGDSAASSKLDEWLKIQERVETTLVEAGSGPLLEEVKERVGLAPPGVEPGRNVGFEEVPDVYRIRQIGQTIHFQGTTSGDPSQSSTLVPAP